MEDKSESLSSTESQSETRLAPEWLTTGYVASPALSSASSALSFKPTKQTQPKTRGRGRGRNSKQKPESLASSQDDRRTKSSPSIDLRKSDSVVVRAQSEAHMSHHKPMKSVSPKVTPLSPPSLSDSRRVQSPLTIPMPPVLAKPQAKRTSTSKLTASGSSIQRPVNMSAKSISGGVPGGLVSCFVWFCIADLLAI